MYIFCINEKKIINWLSLQKKAQYKKPQVPQNGFLYCKCSFVSICHISKYN